MVASRRSRAEQWGEAFSSQNEPARTGEKRKGGASTEISGPAKRSKKAPVDETGKLDLSGFELNEDEVVDPELVPGVEGEVRYLERSKDSTDPGVGLRSLHQPRKISILPGYVAPPSRWPRRFLVSIVHDTRERVQLQGKERRLEHFKTSGSQENREGRRASEGSAAGGGKLEEGKKRPCEGTVKEEGERWGGGSDWEDDPEHNG